MRVQDRAGAARRHDFDMQRRFGRGGAVAGEDAPVAVLEDVAGRQLALVGAAARDHEAQWIAARDRAEVAARSERPSTRVQPVSEAGQLIREGLERPSADLTTSPKRACSTT